MSGIVRTELGHVSTYLELFDEPVTIQGSLLHAGELGSHVSSLLG